VKNRIDAVLLPVNTLTLLMPAIFFAVVMTVGFLFTSLIIRQSRREIGILRALGFSAGDIRLLFCKVNLPVSLGAIILGTLISIGIARYIGSAFESFFPLPFYENVFDTGNAVFSALLTVVVGQAATLSGTSLISRIQPSEAMSRQPPSSGKLSGFGRWLTRKAGPFTRYSIISLLRNKKRFIFSVFCLSASVMIIFASLSFIASKNAILTELFEKQIHYDCQVFLKDAPDKAFTEELEALDYVSGILQTDCYTSDISFQGHTETASVNALPEDTDMIRIFGTKNEPLSVPSEGILLEKHLAAELGAVPGDFVLVDGVRMEVADISNQNVNRSQYISARQAEKLGEPAIRTILIRTEETDETAAVEGEHSVQALLAGRDDYLHCVFTRLFRDGMEKYFAIYDLAAWIIIGFAVLIGLIIVVNTMQTNLLEQKKEL
jgi:putative ABC transport system permease protein